MSNLFSAVNDGGARTWNGMKTNSTSLRPTVDLFYTIGSARGKFETVVADLSAAIGDDKDAAIRILLWARDVREGAGERQTFRDAVDFLASNSLITVDEARRVMKKVPELGRWDDLTAFFGTVLEDEALTIWANAIDQSNGLAAKWAPRKGEVANKLRRKMVLSPRDYRKTVVAATNVVEQKMCANQWEEINFSHVPSMASSRYQKAFGRNAPEAYAEYKKELQKPEAERNPNVKINANAIYPYNIVQAVRNGDSAVASEQWKALPDYMEGSEYMGIMPLIDVSGSMSCPAGGYGGFSYKPDYVSCLDVAVSLGLYLSERNRGPFKDEFITFSGNPKMVHLSGDLKNRVHQMVRSDWGMNTNVVAAFELILKAAKRHNLPQEDVPRTLLIVSDMQFDYCAEYDDSALESVHRKFTVAGYEVPNVVFWNVNSSGNGVPTTADKHGTALISGFSPSIMKSVLNAEELTPESIMRKTIMDSRYDW